MHPRSILTRWTFTAVATLSLLTIGIPSESQACSTFLIQGPEGPVFGKSYDWHDGGGHWISNPRGLKKSALALIPSPHSLEWTSQYASLTFNQYGWEFPNGGMNEAGLMVEIMWLNEAHFPQPDAKPGITELQWIQYHLDQHASVSQMVKASRKIRISPAYAKVHFLACDARGECAAFEYLKGKLHIYQGASLPYPALTNHTYNQSISDFKERIQVGRIPRAKDASSLTRFYRCAQASQRPYASKQGVKTAFNILSSVSAGAYTKWQIVYEPKSLKVHYRDRVTGWVKTVHFKSLAATCPPKATYLDLALPVPGPVTAYFQPLTTTVNQNRVQTSISKLSPVAALLVPSIVGYPQSVRCGD